MKECEMGWLLKGSFNNAKSEIHGPVVIIVCDMV